LENRDFGKQKKLLTNSKRSNTIAGDLDEIPNHKRKYLPFHKRLKFC